MTDAMANLSISVLLSEAKRTLCIDCNSFIIASTVSDYTLWQMTLGVLVDVSTSLLHIAFYDHRKSTADTVFHEI